MSNYSDFKAEDARIGVDNGDGLSSLLAAIADELARTAGEVVKLGELLSDQTNTGERPREPYGLQAFDRLSQAVQAQARLLKRLAEHSAGSSRARIQTSIEEVPFFQVRQRLLAAADGVTSEQRNIDQQDDDDVSWF